jgi:hypothetical protein
MMHDSLDGPIDPSWPHSAIAAHPRWNGVHFVVPTDSCHRC